MFNKIKWKNNDHQLASITNLNDKVMVRFFDAPIVGRQIFRTFQAQNYYVLLKFDLTDFFGQKRWIMYLAKKNKNDCEKWPDQCENNAIVFRWTFAPFDCLLHCRLWVWRSEQRWVSASQRQLPFLVSHRQCFQLSNWAVPSMCVPGSVPQNIYNHFHAFMIFFDCVWILKFAPFFLPTRY